MNCRLPGTKGKKLVYHPPRCSSGTNCSQTWLLSTWQAWLSSMSPLSLTSSPHAAILLPHGLLEPHNVGLCLPSISIFRQQVCSISLQPHEDVHEHMPKNTHVDSCKLGCDHSITSLSRQTSTDGKWLMCESLETLGTPWSHTGDDEKKKNVWEKNVHIPSFWYPRAPQPWFTFELQQLQGREQSLICAVHTHTYMKSNE